MVPRLCLLPVLIVLLVCGVAAQSNSPQQVQIPPGTSQGLLISKVQPTYPPLARQARVQGTVVLHALIGNDGSIQDLSVVSGHPMLTQAAMDAVKQWRYQPYLLNGEPVLVETTINVNFQLSGPPSEAQSNQPAGNTAASANNGGANPSQGQESDLKAYTTCDLGPDFQIAWVDGPVNDFAWPTPTKDGEVRIPVETGFRVLATYKETELFGNLKVERLPKAHYLEEKANLLSSLEYLSKEPGMEPNVQIDVRNGQTLYGTTRNKLEGGVLSIYNLFLDDKSVVISMYLLNAEPADRKFSTLDEYKKIRDQFLDAYTKCVASAQKSAPAEVATTAKTQTPEPGANTAASTGGSSSPAPAQQTGQSAASNQYPGVYRVGGDVTPPKATYAPDPGYSEEARKAKLEGTVVLWLVVDANGLPQKIRVQRSLGMGMDEEAIKAVKQWRFEPATKNGHPVPVMINAQVNFKLSSSESGSSNLPKSPLASPGATSSPSQQGYIIERRVTKLVYDADGTGSQEVTAAMRVQSQAGVQDLAVLTFRYTSYNDTVDLEYVRVKKPDGTVVVTPETNVQDMTAEVTRLAPMYSDVREKHVTVKALGVGDVLEYAVRYRTIRPEVRGQFWYQYSFFKYKIAKDEELEISVPRDKYVKVKSPDYPPQIKDDGARRTYIWKTSNLVAKDREESGNEQESLPPSVQLTTFRDWAEVGGWYEELQRPQLAVTPQIQAKVAELTKGLTSDDAKIRALYDYVSTHFHYVSLSFGIGRYQPHAAEEALENEYGDCKDKHTLLATLLKAAGYDAWPALINSSRKIDPDVPSPGQFDHVITVVPRGNSLIWLDTTPGVSPFGLLLGSLRDKQALVIPTGKPASLMTTPANPPFPGVQAFLADGKLTPDGTFTGHMQSTARGDEEVIYRLTFRQYPAAQWKDLVQRLSFIWGFAGDVSNVTASNPEDTAKPFEFAYDYKRDKFGDWDNHRISLPLPLTGAEPASLEKKKPQEPVLLGALGTVVYKAKIELPRGLTPTVPDKVDVTEDFADYHASYAFKDGVLTANRQLTIKKNKVPLVEWDAYKRFSQAISDDHRRLIDLEVGASSAPSSPSSNPEADRLFKESYNALQNRDLTRAEEDLNHLLQLDPKYPYAHANLGTVYLDEGNVEGGIRELRKEEELNPNESYAYRMLARALLYKHERPEAIVQLQKLLLLDPKDRDAALSLGQLLSAEKRYPEAVTVLQKASEQAPDSATLQYQLGYAYLNNGEKDKGLAVLQKALSAETDSSRSSNEMNSVAYTLIEMDTGLDLAKQYALKALAEQEAASLKAGTERAGLRNTSSLGATWDTVGWLYYHLGKYDEALPYLQASWILIQHPEVGDHLGQLYAKLGKKQEAVHVYRLAFSASGQNTRTPANPAVLHSITEHYKALMGANANPGSFTTTRKGDGTFTPMPIEELSRMRMVKITTKPHPSAHGTVSIVFSPGKIEEVTMVDGDATLKSMVERIPAAKFNVEFPDQKPTRLVRRGIVSCGSVGCEVTLLLPDDRSLLAAE